jgi:glycosyltransferase involved in cell wall biosynthesis
MKKKVAILYPSFNGGGAQAVCLWILDALKEACGVTLFTLTPRSFETFDYMYGTHLATSNIRVSSPVLSFLPSSLSGWFLRSGSLRPYRQHLLTNHFRRCRNEYDLAISAYNEMDLGQPGIQYMHDVPSFVTGNRILQRISQYSESRMKKNLTLVGSRWMARHVKRCYGIDATVLYPPVRSVFPHTPWDEREDGFICVARLSPEKRVEDAIQIVQSVREQGFDVHLHILVSGSKVAYRHRILRLLRKHKPWVFLEEGISDTRYRDILGRHKYGINTAETESFGIGIAEMVNAGCIPFIRGTGGQSEILDGNKTLTFHDIEEAVRKTADTVESCRLAGNPYVDSLVKRAGSFSIKRFQEQILSLVHDYFAMHGS